VKHHYFGDRHDFYKYDLLLYLMGAGLGFEKLLFGVMLTPGDGSTDGAFTSYAAKNRDPELCAWLQERVRAGERDVARLADYPAICEAPWAYSAVLDEVPPEPLLRAAYFARLRDELAPATLAFLDPDNGLMVQSATRKSRPKYVDHDEVRDLHDAMDARSLLVVFQHARRETRAPFYARLLAELGERSGVTHTALVAPDHLVSYILIAKTGERLVEVEQALAAYLARNDFSWPPRQSG